MACREGLIPPTYIYSVADLLVVRSVQHLPPPASYRLRTQIATLRMTSDTPPGLSPHAGLTTPSLVAYPRVAAWLFDDDDPENLFSAIPVSDMDHS